MSDVLYEQKPPHVYAAIAEVTGKLAKTGIGKDRKNDQQGYKFRGIDDVYNALSALIAEAKLCILPRVTSREITERQTQRGGVLFYVVCGIDFTLVSAVDGSMHTVHVIGEAMDSGDKATNKAMSAGYKYMAMQVFCIPTEGDNDADATTHTIKPAEKAIPYQDQSKQAGIGVHSPLGDVTVTPEVEAYANALRTAVDPVAIKQVAADLHGEGEETYRAVWAQLDSKTRSRIKSVLATKEAA